MLYKNVLLAIAVFVLAIATPIIASKSYVEQAEDYSALQEYTGSDRINLAKDVKIENLEYLYFYGEGQVNDYKGWAYKTVYVKSLLENTYGKSSEIIFTYKGQRIKFDYTVSLPDGVLTIEKGNSNEPVKFRVTANGGNVSGSLDFELNAMEITNNRQLPKALPRIILFYLTGSLVVCVLFAVIDYKKQMGFFAMRPYAEVLLSRDPKTLTPKERAKRKQFLRAQEAAAEKEAYLKKVERVKLYEEKYDLSKPENMVFKEIAYGTIEKVFLTEDDFKLIDPTISDNAK